MSDVPMSQTHGHGAEAALLAPVPPCKGCDSINLVTVSKTTVYAEWSDPLGVDEFGRLIFASSYSGDAQNETWRTECLDCGRKVRNSMPPWDVGR